MLAGKLFGYWWEIDPDKYSSVPLYMISFYELPKGVRKRIDFFRSRFLWQEDQGVKKGSRNITYSIGKLFALLMNKGVWGY